MAYNKSNKQVYSIRADYSILHTQQLNKLKRLKFLSIKYNPETCEYEKRELYKSIGEADKKMIFFDVLVSYQLDNNNKLFHPYFNIYIPTLFLDYVNFCFKSNLLSNMEQIKIDELNKLQEDVYMLFKAQNKDYTYDDYRIIKEAIAESKKDDFKTRIKALHDYTMDKKIPGFYFYLAVMYDMIPLKYMIKCSIDGALKKKYQPIFVKEPEDKPGFKPSFNKPYRPKKFDRKDRSGE